MPWTVKTGCRQLTKDKDPLQPACVNKVHWPTSFLHSENMYIVEI